MNNESTPEEEKWYKYDVCYYGNPDAYPIASFTTITDAGDFMHKLSDLMGEYDCISDYKFCIVEF